MKYINLVGELVSITSYTHQRNIVRRLREQLKARDSMIKKLSSFIGEHLLANQTEKHVQRIVKNLNKAFLAAKSRDVKAEFLLDQVRNDFFKANTL